MGESKERMKKTGQRKKLKKNLNSWELSEHRIHKKKPWDLVKMRTFCSTKQTIRIGFNLFGVESSGAALERGFCCAPSWIKWMVEREIIDTWLEFECWIFIMKLNCTKIFPTKFLSFCFFVRMANDIQLISI